MSPAITSVCLNVHPSHHNHALKSTSTNPFLNKNKGSSLSGVNPIVKNHLYINDVRPIALDSLILYRLLQSMVASHAREHLQHAGDHKTK